ncbi:MAG: hypothetical protein E7514_03310 [Ruminococcaceae bacterium]|nr:hypothetical protein [Oscillospiraceae bacterium]
MNFSAHISFKKFISLALVLVMTALLFSSCGKGRGVTAAKITSVETVGTKLSSAEYHTVNEENLVYVAKSGLLEMYLDSVSYAVAIKETGTGKMWLSLPSAASAPADYGASVININISKGDKLYKLNSQDNSVALGSASFKTLDSGIEITYNIALDAATANKSVNALSAGELYASVTVAYELADGAFYTKINCKDIVLSEGYAVEKIMLLDCFGAFGEAADGDYILVPDANGAVIKPDRQSSYSERHYKVYGDNLGACENSDAFDGIRYAPALFAAFGVKTGENAFMGIVLSGDAVCEIDSYAQSASNPYNRVGTSFNITETCYNGAAKYTGAVYKGDINICYRFLSGRNASYLGLATACREMMIRNSVLSSEMLEPSTHIPFMLTVNGAVSKGSAHSYEKLSTYEQTQDLLEVLKAKSVNSIVLNYAGALEGANTQDILSDASRIKKLGSKKDFDSLRQYVKTQKFSMYLDFSLFSFNRSSAKASKYAAKDIAGNYISTSNFDKLFNMTKKNQVLFTSLSHLSAGVEKFIGNLDESRFDGYCINDAGRYLYSDYSSDTYTRSNAANMISSQLSVLSNNHKIMVERGNFCTLKYADMVLNLPRNTTYPEDDGYRQIPFAELVLHGLVNYSLEPINLCEDSEKAFLQSVEYGAMPSYEWICTEKQGYEEYYYNNSVVEASEYYLRADNVLGDLADARLTNNYEVQDGVHLSEYNNSILIYFNYSSEPVTVNSMVIAPMNFVRAN